MESTETSLLARDQAIEERTAVSASQVWHLSRPDVLGTIKHARTNKTQGVASTSAAKEDQGPDVRQAIEDVLARINVEEDQARTAHQETSDNAQKPAIKPPGEEPACISRISRILLLCI